VNRFLFIAIGAALGANARYLIGLWAANRLGAAFPYGTLIVNITGSFLLGFVITLTTERLTIAPEARLLLAVGFLGSYTTFSSFTVESLGLLRDSGLWPGLINILANNMIGIICAALGVYLARLIGR
jgi:CrcB protein